MLLIGAGGFLGGQLREAAAAAGLRVIAADRRSGPDASACDLLEPASVEACVESARPELIVNLAGLRLGGGELAGPGRRLRRQRHRRPEPARGGLPSRSAGARRLRLLGGGLRGARGEAIAVHRGHPPEPVTPYGAGKLAMEAICGQYARARDLRIATIRPFNQIGPGQSASYALSGFARQIAAAEAAGEERVEMSVGNLSVQRDFTDARDTARAFLDVSRGGLTGVYNLCSGRPLGLEAVIEEMGRASTLPLQITVDPSLKRPRDPAVVYGDPSRLREATGWEPRVPLEQTVADLLGLVAGRAGRCLGPAPHILSGDGESEQQRRRGGRTAHDRAPCRPRRRARLHRLRDRDRAALHGGGRGARPRGAARASPASRPSPAASTRACIATGSGRCASTPASPPPRTPTSATAT